MIKRALWIEKGETATNSGFSFLVFLLFCLFPALIHFSESVSFGYLNLHLLTRYLFDDTIISTRQMFLRSGKIYNVT